jgi:hypothetical protein
MFIGFSPQFSSAFIPPFPEGPAETINNESLEIV